MTTRRTRRSACRPLRCPTPVQALTEAPVTDHRAPATAATASPTAAVPVTPPLRVGRSAPWTGWVRFGGVLMAITGAFALVEGLLVLFAPTAFVTGDGTVIAVDAHAWAWAHLVLGVLVLVTGLGLLRDAPDWARIAAMALVGLQMGVQFAWFPAAPIWSVLLITIDVLVLYALVTTWHDASRRGHGRAE